LVTGASGLLGANLVLAARERHAVTAVCHRHPVALDGVDGLVLDLTRPTAAEELIGQVRPEWIVHCAAAADVDRCEDDPAWAAQLNVETAGRIAAAAVRVGARLVHISTDAVFDGERGGYRETDTPRPLGVYGRTKLEGERAVLAAAPLAVVLRVNFFGWHPWARRGLAEWFLSRLEAGWTAPGFVDAWVSPMLVNDLAERLLAIAALPVTGVYHLAGAECLSKYEFGRRLARAFGVDEDLVRPARIDEAGLRAPRPRNLCLDASRLTADASLVAPGIGEGIARFRKLRDSGYVELLKGMTKAAERVEQSPRGEDRP
jgi:dTDP-4-dehydrorhamnose reductase